MYDIKIKKELKEKSTKKSSKKAEKEERMEYMQYNLEELQNIFDKEQSLKELNKTMSPLVDKQDVLSEANEETNKVQLEEEIYQ